MRWIYEKEYVIAPAGAPAQTFQVPSQLDTRLSVLEGMVGRLRGQQTFVVDPALARAHTRIINALHEYFPIYDIPFEHIETFTGASGPLRAIRKLDVTIADAAECGILFGETNARWAHRAVLQQLDGYESFRGCWPKAVTAV
jgi:hypothetical protein